MCVTHVFILRPGQDDQAEILVRWLDYDSCVVADGLDGGEDEGGVRAPSWLGGLDCLMSLEPCLGDVLFQWVCPLGALVWEPGGGRTGQ